jgi:hypothetical protein
MPTVYLDGVDGNIFQELTAKARRTLLKTL